MLSMVVLAAMAVAQDGRATSVEKTGLPEIKFCSQGDVALVDGQCAPRLSDHRYAWSVKPQETLLTTEWRCEGAEEPSKATVRITEEHFVNERGQPVRNYAFDVDLVSVRVEGMPASKATIERVREVLEPLNTISIFAGRCRYAGSSVEEPLLAIFGFALGERERKEAEVRLRDTPPPTPPIKSDGILPDLRIVLSCQAPPGPATEALIENALYAAGFDVLNTTEFYQAIDRHSAHGLRIEAVDDQGRLVFARAPDGLPHRLFISLLSKPPTVRDAQLESRIEALAAEIRRSGCDLVKSGRNDNPASQAWVFDALASMTSNSLKEAREKVPASGSFRVH